MKIGVVGWGEIGRHHASHFSPNGAERPGAVVSRRRDLELDVPVFPTLSEMLPHVDAITVAVPNHLHAPMCLQAIEARKPVLVEKPLCIRKSELAELESAFENLDVPVRLGFRLRWSRTMRTLDARLRNPRRIQCIYRMGIEKLAHDKDWTRPARAHRRGVLYPRRPRARHRPVACRRRRRAPRELAGQRDPS